jgi:hypothetical protein
MMVFHQHAVYKNNHLCIIKPLKASKTISFSVDNVSLIFIAIFLFQQHQVCLQNNICDRLRQLIRENELEKVIQELSKLLKNSPKLDEAILQSSRWNDLKKQIRLGQIPYEQSDVSKNQIRAGLLELINSVEEKVAEPEIEEEVVQHLQTISGKNILSNSTITAGGNVNIGDQIQHYHGE